MSRIRPAAVLLALLAALPAAAQDSIQLAGLRTPTSPAFVLLGVEPTSIERPSTPRAFALGLLSSARGSGGYVPENYAAEVAPYWLAPHRSLTFTEYYRPTLTQALAQTFSVSLATARRTVGVDSAIGIGLGFRVSPRPGRPSAAVDSLVAALDRLQDERVDLLRQRSAAQAQQNADEVARLNALLQANGRQSPAVSAQIREKLLADDERVGLRLQLAGGLAALYPDDDFGAGRVGNTGVWGTAAYRLEGTRVDLLALGRYLGGEGNRRAWDVGGRAVVDIERLALSAEFIARSAAGDGAAENVRNTADGLASGNRLVGQLEYRATDDLFVSFSFGQDYRRPGAAGSPVVAILGGSLNFGSKPSLVLP
jgi:hypothetical protein